MRVVVAEIPEEGLRLQERFDPVVLHLQTSELTYAAPLEVSAFFQRHDKDLSVLVQAQSALALTCARCLTIFKRPYQETFHLAVEIRGRLSIDVTDDIRQEILLSYPLTWLCRPDCRGLCPACGQNLNEGTCNCKTVPGAI